jgi:hypothetical protein
MVRRGVAFSEVVSQVVSTPAPVNNEMALCNTVAHPLKALVDGLQAPLIHGVVSNSGGSGIVGLDGGSRLGMTHVG